MGSRTRVAPTLLALPLAVLLSGAATSPPDALDPAAGRFLVATRQVSGSIFAESVVLLLSYGSTEALGLIVNRPTDTSLQALFPGIGPSAGALHLGGPVTPRSMLVLLRAAAPPARAHQVTGDLFVTSDEATLRGAASQQGAPERLRVYAGYAGWSAGQLDREIARGDWIVARVSPDAVFDPAPEALWERLYVEHHRLLARAQADAAAAQPWPGRLVRRGGGR